MTVRIESDVAMKERYIERILKARVYDVARKTPLDHAPLLSNRLRNQIYLKREDLQDVFSFKLRGAYNKMAQLTDEQKQRGVIAASAGNHAQGVALSARKLGIEALIVMPTTTPQIKVKSVQNRGAKVVLHGDTYDEAADHCYTLVEKKGYVLVHPYDDPDVIAGQGTIAMEILQQIPSTLDKIFVPVGGGGLIAGVAVYIKQLYPHIQVIGVEPQDAPCMHNALQEGKRVVLEQVGIFADGVAVRQVGEEPFRVASECVDKMILVTTDEICAAIKDIYDDTRSIVEPAGALGVAGIKKYLETETCEGETLVAINSGANINFDRLRHVAERAEIGEQREMLLGVTIPEKPGSFRHFCELIGHRNITEFNYRYADNSRAHVFVGVESSGAASDKSSLLQRLQGDDYQVLDLTDNEMAKLHIRYMVGGRAQGLKNEKLYRFQFPERPGALLRFLNKMGQNWNISLFHYRNHGAAYGRILVGIQIDDSEQASFQEFLDELGYRYWPEQDNPVYQLFIGTD